MRKTDLLEMWVARPTLNVGVDLYGLGPGLNEKGKVRQAAVFAALCTLSFPLQPHNFSTVTG